MPRHRVIPISHVAVLLLAASALLLSPVGLRLEESLGLSLLFGLRGERQPPPAVALVALDEDSVAALDLPDLDQLDRWPRQIYAQLIRQLHAHGVAVIALDIAFLSSGDPSGDGDLAAALHEAGNVTLLKLLDRLTTGENTVAWQSEPLPLFAANAAAVNTFTLPDHAVKKYTSLFPRTPEGYEAAMPLVALQLYHADARATLLAMLQKLGEFALSQQLDAEARPAFFAALVRTALHKRPALARSLEQQCANWPQREAAQRLLPLLHAWQQHDPTYINFYGPQRSIPTVSLHAALHDSQTVAALRGKVVFVGLSERHQKQRDYFFTVFPAAGDSRISGVEVAATLFGNLLENRTLRAPAPWQQLAGLWLGGGLLLLAARRLTAPRWLLLTLAFTTLYVAAVVALFSAKALWLPVIVPMLLCAALALLAIWHYYRRSAAAERAATAALSLYVPADVAAAIGHNQQQLLAQRRELDAVCLLTDIVGFTSLSEQRDAGYMHELMNRYYGAIVAEVEQRGGMVANIVGDGLLALWPTTGDERDAAQRAAAAALAIVATSDRLSATLGEQLTTCVGLHSGPISLGHLGAGTHFEYAPVGDTINTTARIEACTRQLQCRILLSASLQPWLDDSTLHCRGEFALKGKHTAQRLYELHTTAIDGS